MKNVRHGNGTSLLRNLRFIGQAGQMTPLSGGNDQLGQFCNLTGLGFKVSVSGLDHRPAGLFNPFTLRPVLQGW